MKRVAISQSNYIPWKGYFDLIASVDTFVLFDDVQYTRRDWRNRNKIKTPTGVKWISIPVHTKGKYHQKINETMVANDVWAMSHWNLIKQNYKNSAYFDQVSQWLEPLYINLKEQNLSIINYTFIQEICLKLNISTRIIHSDIFNMPEDKSERLASICQQLDCQIYVSGPAAKIYLSEDAFASKDIIVEWMDYSGYPQYQQLWGEFHHTVSILDLLFNAGPKASEYMKFV